MIVLRAIAALAVAAAMATAPACQAREFRPELGFMTAPNAMLCLSYFSLKEGEAALRARDQEWLKRAGCLSVPAGMKIDLIEARWTRPGDRAIWEGRVSDADDKPVGNFYFYETDALTFFDAGAFPTEQKAKAAQSSLMKKIRNSVWGKYINSSRIAVFGQNWKLWVGPHDYKTLYLGCGVASGKALCRPVYSISR